VEAESDRVGHIPLLGGQRRKAVRQLLRLILGGDGDHDGRHGLNIFLAREQRQRFVSVAVVRFSHRVQGVMATPGCPVMEKGTADFQLGERTVDEVSLGGVRRGVQRRSPWHIRDAGSGRRPHHHFRVVIPISEFQSRWIGREVSRARALGHSWGCSVAVALGLNDLDSVAGLVLASGYYYPSARADVVTMAEPALPVIGDIFRYTPHFRRVHPIVFRAPGTWFTRWRRSASWRPLTTLQRDPERVAAKTPLSHRSVAHRPSSRSAAAAIMGDTYPELFAAIGVHSGLARGAARDTLSAFAAMQRVSDGIASSRMSLRIVAAIVFHGDRDTVVNPRDGAAVVAQSARPVVLDLT
jgi:pimeloyl-ACP methyl ester carboxylesterase